MSGVLFVVYIPSKLTEERIRLKHGGSQIVNEVTERHGPGGDYGAEAMPNQSETPLTTPEMQQRFQPFQVS